MSNGDYSYSADNKLRQVVLMKRVCCDYNSTVHIRRILSTTAMVQHRTTHIHFHDYTPVGYLTPQPGSEDYRASSGAERIYDPTWESTGGSWNRYTDTTRVDGAPAATHFIHQTTYPHFQTSPSSGAFPPDLGPVHRG
ncbi:hypothetical protein BDQ17DRAFT_1422834 [Cyathus striatus]|nr:hypothetical protein BDQ17DRAFT_1422834 [Cyathus striatus]